MDSIVLPASYYEPPYLPHYPECEDRRHYYCTPCKNLIIEGSQSRNWCDWCAKFAPRSNDCICEALEEIKNG